MIFYNPQQVFTRRSTHSQHPQAEQWLFARAEIDAASMFTCPQKAWGKVIFVQRCSARFACFLDLKSIWGLIWLNFGASLLLYSSNVDNYLFRDFSSCNLLKSQFDPEHMHFACGSEVRNSFYISRCSFHTGEISAAKSRLILR